MRAVRLSAVLILASACVDDPDAGVDVEAVAQPACLNASAQSWRAPVNIGTTSLGIADWPPCASGVTANAPTASRPTRPSPSGSPFLRSSFLRGCLCSTAAAQ